MKIKILIVDDERAILRTLKRFLERNSFTVVMTDHGAEALLLAQESHPDIILTDVNIPGLDGAQLCRVAKQETGGRIPIILMSGSKINENDVSSDAIKQCETILLEGYLWDEGEPKKAFEKAIQSANKVAMSLSDQFCVDRHKPHFLELVKNKLDITFANEQEIMSLIDAKSFDEVISFAKSLNFVPFLDMPLARSSIA